MDQHIFPQTDSKHSTQYDAGHTGTASSSIVQEAFRELSNLSKGNQRPCTETELSPSGTGAFNCQVPEEYKHRRPQPDRHLTPDDFNAPPSNPDWINEQEQARPLPPGGGYQTPDGVWHDNNQVQAKPEKQSSQNPSDTQNFDRSKNSPRTSRDLSPEELKSLPDRLEQGTLKSLAEKAAKDKIKEEAESVCRQMGFGDCSLTYSDN